MEDIREFESGRRRWTGPNGENDITEELLKVGRMLFYSTDLLPLTRNTMPSGPRGEKPNECVLEKVRDGAWTESRVPGAYLPLRRAPATREGHGAASGSKERVGTVAEVDVAHDAPVPSPLNAGRHGPRRHPHWLRRVSVYWGSL